MNERQLYKQQVRKRLDALQAVLRNAARGSFTTLKDTPPDEFADLYSGINMLLGAAQQKIEELNSIRAKNSAIIESIGEGVFVVDRYLHIKLLNARAARLLGLKDKENAVDRMIDDVVPLEDEAGNSIRGEERPVGKALSLKPGKRYVNKKPLYIKKKNGERFPIHVIASPIMLEGNAIGAVGVIRDITEEVRIDHAKSEFISLASHQLRTPLSIISLNLEILFKHFTEILNHTEVKEHLETIRTASTRMIELVSELLNVSKIEMGTLDIITEPFDLNELVAESVKAITALAQKKEITVRVSPHPQAITIESDKRLLRVVIDNVLSNAVKYSDPTSIIEINISKTKSRCAKVSVKDFGCGIPEAEQPHIFSKLFRAGNVRHREEGGTGLGLYIAHSIISALGGAISFVSKEGRGTTFTIDIPKHSSASHYYAGKDS